MSVKTPSDYKIENQSFERKPTGGIQEIAGKPFTVSHIEKFKTKAGETMVIIETDEVFKNIEYKDENDEKIRGDVSRFFASPIEMKRFFGDEQVIKSVNEDGDKIKCEGIEKIPFTKEEISRSANLKGKTHYVFIKSEKPTGRLD